MIRFRKPSSQVRPAAKEESREDDGIVQGPPWSGPGPRSKSASPSPNPPEVLASPEVTEAPAIVVSETPPQDSASVQVEYEQRKPKQILKELNRDVKKDRKKLKVLPGYACSTCTIGPECPEFREGFVCAYRDAFKAFDTRDVNSVIELMTEILDSNKQRWRFARVVETVANSGLPSPDTTRLSQVVMEQAKGLFELQNEVNKITIRTEVHGQMDAAKPAGILSRLFGGQGAPMLPEPMQPVLTINAPDEGERVMDSRGVTNDEAMTIEKD